MNHDEIERELRAAANRTEDVTIAVQFSENTMDTIVHHVESALRSLDTITRQLSITNFNAAFPNACALNGGRGDGSKSKAAAG